MIGVVLVTHGRLGAEFIEVLEHVVGEPQKNMAAVCIGPDDDMEKRRREIIDSVARADEGDGVVLLTDMFGGTPSNLAISVLDQGRVEVIAGVNLPMLIKLAGSFDAEVTVVKNGTAVSGSSILGLMMLAAQPGCELELRARGPAATAALGALAELIAKKFDED